MDQQIRIFFADFNSASAAELAIFVPRLMNIKQAGKQEISNLLNYGQRICDTARPEFLSKRVNALFEFSCDHNSPSTYWCMSPEMSV